MTCAEKLKDRRWQKRRLELMEKAGFKCTEICCHSNGNSTLNIHHRLYLRGKNPWDYDDKHLQVLCEKCHEINQGIMERAHTALADLPELEWFCSRWSQIPESAQRYILDALSTFTDDVPAETQESIAYTMASVTRLYHLGIGQGYLRGKSFKESHCND